MIYRKEEILFKLVTKQLQNVEISKRLQYSDLKRITEYIDGDIFDENKCCIWNGYVTNVGTKNKINYINFYFRGKKIALHRLLYINFVGKLNDDEYIKYSCENKGKCCCVNHLEKCKFNEIKKEKMRKEKLKENISETKEEPKEEIKEEIKKEPQNKNKFTIYF